MPKRQSGEYNYAAFDTSVYGLEPFASGSPRVGECAVDFEAARLDGRRVRLSDFKGKTVILEMGSLTCPMFGGNIEPMNAVAENYADEDTVFLVLYTREAHPGGKTPAHRSNDEKLSVAARAASMLSDKRLVLVDDIQGSAHRQWGEHPNSLWVIGADGVVKFRTDWNHPSLLVGVLDAEDVDAYVTGLTEHNDVDMTKPLPVIKWLYTKAGWRSIWDVVRQQRKMKERHDEVDKFYTGKQFAEARGARKSSCW